ncbi:MAG: hypothetical protein ABIN96_04225 [Rubrivivax sp.]
MWMRVCTVTVWALVAGALAFWGLRLFGSSQPAPSQTQLALPPGAVAGDLTRLLGTDPEPVAVAEAPQAAPDPRFQLVGVVSPRSARAAAEGLAVIVVDDKPARAYRIGAVIDGETVLQSVSPRGASLGPKGGAAVVALDLPPPAAAATGRLPMAGSGLPPGGSGAVPVYRPPNVPQPPPQLTRPAAPPPNFQTFPAKTPQMLQQQQLQLQLQQQQMQQQQLQLQQQQGQSPQTQPAMVDQAGAPLR